MCERDPSPAHFDEDKIVLVMVGLPARGKSFISTKIMAYLRWRGIAAQVFNVGQYRRKALEGNQDAGFFSHSNKTAAQKRNELAMRVLHSLIDWLDDGGTVAIFDATNTTNARRRMVVDAINKRSKHCVQTIFVESICDDQEQLQRNFDQKVRNSPDYKDLPYEEAMADFLQRLRNYERVYEPVTDDEVSYIKLINLAAKVTANRIHGTLAFSIVTYLMSIRNNFRPVWITRSGHCESIQYGPSKSTLTLGKSTKPHRSGTLYKLDTPMARIVNGSASGDGSASESGEGNGELASKPRTSSVGESPGLLLFGNGSLSTQSFDQFPDSALEGTMQGASNQLSSVGLEYAEIVSDFIYSRINKLGSDKRFDNSGVVVYTSTLARCIKTASFIDNARVIPCSSLNNLNKGYCAAMNDEELTAWRTSNEAWQADPFRTRYPDGESYSDRVKNLEPIVMEIERQTRPVVVVSHHATLQAIYGYFLDIPVQEYVNVEVPLHAVIEMVPSLYSHSGWEATLCDLSSELSGEGSSLAAAGLASPETESLETPSYISDGVSTDESPKVYAVPPPFSLNGNEAGGISSGGGGSGGGGSGAGRGAHGNPSGFDSGSVGSGGGAGVGSASGGGSGVGGGTGGAASGGPGSRSRGGSTSDRGDGASSGGGGRGPASPARGSSLLGRSKPRRTSFDKPEIRRQLSQPPVSFDILDDDSEVESSSDHSAAEIVLPNVEVAAEATPVASEGGDAGDDGAGVA